MFYLVIRVFFKGETETHSVEIKNSYKDAQVRFYSIIAADLANEEITYNAAYIIDSNGQFRAGQVFDRRPTPEPEPEPEEEES